MSDDFISLTFFQLETIQAQLDTLSWVGFSLWQQMVLLWTQSPLVWYNIIVYN